MPAAVATSGSITRGCWPVSCSMIVASHFGQVQAWLSFDRFDQFDIARQCRTSSVNIFPGQRGMPPRRFFRTRK